MQNCLNKSIKFGTLTQLTCFMFLIKMVKMLWSYKKYIKKKEIWKRLGQIMTKNLLAHIIPDKKFGTE